MRSRSSWLVWGLLAAPAVWFVSVAEGQSAEDLESLLHPTGELSARLLIVALALTPLGKLFPRARAVRWLLGRRRAIGVAAFGYAALHTLFYVAAMGSADDMLAELGATGIWTGWAALALLAPLALTSTDRAQRWLRSGWKRLQRLAYPAAVLTLAHWALVHNDTWTAVAHFAPLALLQILRVLNRSGARAGLNERQSHA
ncbi:MAG TPA: ferric reductase-like transmembrane domain-containing protein [Sphingomonadaceae bacterium]|nr:ferric reductase-like transmembrane domain-containing protein [Sphingomonadaceae bacterium]